MCKDMKTQTCGITLPRGVAKDERKHKTRTDRRKRSAAGSASSATQSHEILCKIKRFEAFARITRTYFCLRSRSFRRECLGHVIVTAPTCGSCGVLPAVLYHLQNTKDFMDTRILRALATAGLFGNVVKENASISGAEVGCQGEVGVACAMAAAAASQLFGGSLSQIEYAAEMGLEHHLGMTCDPVCGLVQIPCIERNAYAALRALETPTSIPRLPTECTVFRSTAW